MGKIIILSVFVITTALVYAQGDTVGYESIFGRESTVWHGGTQYWDSWWENQKMQAKDDTLIGDFEYRKIECFHIYRTEECCFYEGNFYLREDTISGKVWCRYPEWVLQTYNIATENVDTDFLVMNLNLDIGDSIMLLSKCGIGFRDIIYYVSSVTFDNGAKQIILEAPEDDKGYAHTIRFMEGIGPSNLFGLFLVDQIMDVLLCCQKDGELVYHISDDNMNLGEDQCIIPSLEIDNAVINQHPMFFPNPCNNKIVISGENIHLAEIYSMTGCLLHTIRTVDNPVDIGMLKQGFYILRVYTNTDTSNNILIKNN